VVAGFTKVFKIESLTLKVAELVASLLMLVILPLVCPVSNEEANIVFIEAVKAVLTLLIALKSKSVNFIAVKGPSNFIVVLSHPAS